MRGVNGSGGVFFSEIVAAEAGLRNSSTEVVFLDFSC